MLSAACRMYGRRVPEECPQEVADLILRCNGPAAERPTAAQCANIMADYLPRTSKGMGRALSSRAASA